MSGEARLQKALKKLQDNGSIPESACSGSFLSRIHPLISSGILSWEKSGAGRRLAMRNAAAFSDFYSKHFPHSEEQTSAAPRRVQGVARFRRSKAVRGTDEDIVLVRGWRNGQLLHNGEVLPVSEPTRMHGLLAFLLRSETTYKLCGRVATVENQTVFTNFERLNTGISLALYTQGCLSKRVITWLAAQTGAGLEIVHVGDYDPTGLEEYRRLRKACGKNVSLFLLPNLKQLFHDYSDPSLIKRARSQALLQRLRLVEDVALRTVLGYIDDENAGLEHEGLLIDIDCPA
jgi:hypothetical protein